MRLAFRAEIRPTPRQRAALLQHAGNARYAYNWGLRQHREAYEQWVAKGKPKRWKGWLNAIGLHRDLNVLKRTAPEDGGIPWMCEASKAAPQEALRDLDRAFKNFLPGRARYPRFKSRNKGIGGFRLTGTIRADARTIQLPVIGRVKFQPGERGYLPWVSVTEQADGSCLWSDPRPMRPPSTGKRLWALISVSLDWLPCLTARSSRTREPWQQGSGRSSDSNRR